MDTSATFPGGFPEETGLDGLRAYLKTKVQDEFVDNLSRKLLAYALGRTLLPLPTKSPRCRFCTKNSRGCDGYRFDTLIESVITSRQFLTKRATPGT